MISHPLTSLLFLLLLTGCLPTESEPDTKGSGWTIVEGALDLEEDLFLTDNQSFYFGGVGDIEVARNGRLYVSDYRAQHVKVLSPEGELLETFGRQGEAPGEFQHLSEMTLGRRDSIFVFDGTTERLTAFGPDHELAYSITVQREEGYPGWMNVLEKGSFLFRYPPLYSPGAEVRPDTMLGAIRGVNYAGEPGAAIHQHRPGESVLDIGPNHMRNWHLPFGRTAQYALGPNDRLYYGWTDSLAVEVYDLQGQQVESVQLPFERIPVTDADIQTALEDLNEEHREAVEGEIPQTKPAFTRLLVDDARRLWFKRPTEDPDRADWWIVDVDIKQVAIVPLPNKVTLQVVRDGYAYGRTQDGRGAPAVVRYRITE